MKKLFFIFILFSLFSFSIKADTCTTTNLLKPSSFVPGFYTFVDGSYVYNSGTINGANAYSYSSYISISPNTTYSFGFYSRVYSSGTCRYQYTLFDENYVRVDGSNAMDSDGYCDFDFSFSTPSNAKYLTISITNSNISDVVNTFNYQLNIGSSLLEYSEYVDCPSEPTPVEPTIDLTPSEILTNFYSLYLDKLKFLSDTANTNFIFLSFVCMFLFVAVIELFIYLFRRCLR